MATERNRLRTGCATSEQSRERLNICIGERPATAQGRALAAAQGSALATVRNRLRTGRATSEQSRERLNNCTGERPATAQGRALAAAHGSALATIRNRLRTGPAPSEETWERLNICTGERPATARRCALAAAQGSAQATARELPRPLRNVDRLLRRQLLSTRPPVVDPSRTLRGVDHRRVREHETPPASCPERIQILKCVVFALQSRTQGPCHVLPGCHDGVGGNTNKEAAISPRKACA